MDFYTKESIESVVNIDTAVQAHEMWKVRLRSYLDGQSTEQLTPQTVCLDDRCDLGKWLHGSAKHRYGSSALFTSLITRHKYFHEQASSVVACHQASNKAQAEHILRTTYRFASAQTVYMLKRLKSRYEL